jgi:chaperonin cofactor prefoldin
MTERKQLKKKLAKLKQYKAELPRLIDNSNVYGDGYYTKDDLSDVNNQINEVEKQIAEIDRQQSSQI